MKEKLTAKQVAQYATGKEPGRYGDGRGLTLQVINPDNVSWIFRYQRGLNEQGKPKEYWMGLGPLDDVNLEKARKLAQAARELLREGKDPLKMRRQEKTTATLAAARSVTFADAAKKYHALHSPEWRNPKHARQYLESLANHVFPVLGKLPVAAIDTPAVIRVLTPLWADKTDTAQRLRGRIEAVLSFATVSGWRSGDNPARWRGHLSELLPARGRHKVKHHRALAYSDLPGFVAQLGKAEGVPARALEFLILTAARTGEVMGARWSEIDQATKTWTLPAERMKAGREHRVPLSDRALEILQALPPRIEGNEFVFVGRHADTSISSAAMSHVLRRLKRTDFVVHGLRGSFKTWSAEKMTYPDHVSELALAHQVGNDVLRSYLHTDLIDQRANLMRDWAKFLSSPHQRDNVVTDIRSRVKG